MFQIFFLENNPDQQNFTKRITQKQNNAYPKFFGALNRNQYIMKLLHCAVRLSCVKLVFECVLVYLFILIRLYVYVYVNM